MRFNAFRLRQVSEARFLQQFKEKFGRPEETTVFLGDWSANHTLRGQVPSKTKGFRKMFKSFGYDLYLVDEYRSSKLCFDCHEELEKNFHRRVSPKPWRHDIVTVHGLLRCQSDYCRRLWGNQLNYWNRDLNAVLNIQYIVEETRRTGERPLPFRRND